MCLFFLLHEDGSQVCKSDQRPSTLPVGPVVTIMGSLQTPTPNSTGGVYGFFIVVMLLSPYILDLLDYFTDTTNKSIVDSITVVFKIF